MRTPIRFESVALCAVTLCAEPVWGAGVQPDSGGERFWAEADVGYARLSRHAASESVRSNTFAFDLAGGIRVSPQLRIGLDFGGFTLQATCASPFCNGQELEQGKGIEHLLAVADFRPRVRDGWLVRAGVGPSGYWAQSAGNHSNWNGWEAELGTGYTWRLGMAGHVGLRAGYGFGHVGGDSNRQIPEFDYSAVKVSVTVAYY